MIREDIVYKDLSYTIVGILFDIYNKLGSGHFERVYQKAIAFALAERKINFEQQLSCQLKYNNEVVGRYYLDFLIEGKIVLEIKRNMRFSKQDFDQIKNYLNSTGIKLGILATFANNSVKFSKVLNIR